MGTAAFDAAWDGHADSHTSHHDALDALWAATPDPDALHAARLAKARAIQIEPADDGPSYAQRALGGIAALVHDIPGAEAAQAGARALFRGESYRNALSEIQQAEAAAPRAVRVMNNMIGGTVAAAAMPGSMPLARQGALYGAASGALQANPDAGLRQRGKDAVIGGALGGVVSKAGDTAMNALRAKFAPKLGAIAIKRADQMAQADLENYGRAAAEGKAAGGSTPAIRAALARPDLKPYVDIVNESPVLQGADDATKLREVYQLVSERERSLGKRILNAGPNDYKAGSSLERRDIAAGKAGMREAAATPGTETVQTAPAVPPGVMVGSPAQTVPALTTAQSPTPSLREAMDNFWVRQGVAAARSEGTPEQQLARSALERHGAEASLPGIRGAAIEHVIPGVPDRGIPGVSAKMHTRAIPPAMPSFPAAVAEHARMAGVEDAAANAADATRRLITERHIAGSNLTTQSPEAFMRDIRQMTPDEARAALEAALGRAGEYVGFSPNALSLFGAGPSIRASAGVSPYIRALEQQQGGAPWSINALRAFFAGNGSPHF